MDKTMTAIELNNAGTREQVKLEIPIGRIL
jgi:hypothetical protein